MPQPYKALSFDCYGTLINWEAGIIANLREMPLPGQKNLSDDAIFTRFLEAETKVINSLESADYERILCETYLELSAGRGMPKLEDLAICFSRSAGTWKPFADTNPTLLKLSEHCALAILSNIHDAAMKQSMTKLDVEFDIVLTAEKIGGFKPARQNFKTLIEALKCRGIDRTELLHVSVSKFHDLIPISELGVDTCWINRAGTENGTLGGSPGPVNNFTPTYSFSSLAEMYASGEILLD